MMKKTLTALLVAAALASGALAAAPAADADTGRVTVGGNVHVTLSVYDGCAEITWPKGYTEFRCNWSRWTTQGPVARGTRFGGSITAVSDELVTCRVVDLATGNVIWSDASVGGTADCTRVSR